MFYSQEVLTSRKYGVATIWLVATLGSKSTLKKVNRKEILNVNVPKAVETILEPEAPMALRLQSNLLYGVSRVYSQQCGYVLADAQNAQSNMRALFKVVKTADEEAQAGHVARPETITLQMDPNFDPEVDFGRYMDAQQMELDFTTSDSSQRSSILSPHSAASSALESEHYDPSVGGLIIPASASSATGGPLGLGFAGSEGRGASRFGNGTFQADDGEDLLDDPGFYFDENGDFQQGIRAAAAPASVARLPPVSTGGVVPASGGGLRHGVMPTQNLAEDDFLPLQDDYDLHPDAEAFPIRQHADPDHNVRAETEPTDSAAAAPVRRSRQRKVIPLDREVELHNRDLADWSTNYLANMHDANTHREHVRSTAVAKRNAKFWVLGNGLGGLSGYYGSSFVPEPLRMFTGDAVFSSLTGKDLIAAGEKHGRDGDNADDEDRRVRARNEMGEAGRGDGDFLPGYGGDTELITRDDTIEMGREGQTPLAEHPSAMPWNSASLHRMSSAHARGTMLSAGAGFGTSSVAGGLPSSLGHRGGRLVSASPLQGRGRRSGGLIEGFDDVQPPFADVAAVQLTSDLAGEGFQLAGQVDDFETFGAAANVDTQTAGTATWMRQALDSESSNFLAFVQASIQEHEADELAPEEEAADEPSRGSIAFETLLPPEANSRVVAAQGLLHVLSLVTMDVLSADQNGPFEDITLRLL